MEKNGVLHTEFNHKEFACAVKECKHSWLITYDDSPEIRKNFSFANIYEWELQYGMNNYKQGKAEKGNELFISNYLLPIKSKIKVEKEEVGSV
jgi:DNA adenine methylase